MKDKLTNLKSELDNLKAINVVTKSFVESFNNYINTIFYKEFDYQFITNNDELKNRLIENSRRMALFEIGLGNNRDEDFKNFILTIHLQIDDLVNYYFISKYSNFSEIEKSFDDFVKKRFFSFYKITYDEFKSEYMSLQELKKNNSNSFEEQSKLFEKKFSNLLYKNNQKSIYKTFEDAINIEKVGEKKKIQLIDFKKRLSLFEFEQNTDWNKNSLRASINILRNVLLHNVADVNAKAKAEILLKSNDFIGCKEVLKEIYLKVVNFTASSVE
jgi:hypothetical protein